MKRIILVLGITLLAGCAGTPPAITGPIGGAAPTLSWTSSFASGSQSGPIVFQSAGQTATLTMSDPNPVPRYDLTAQPCVTLSSPTANGPVGTVTVTAASAGTCTVTVNANGAIGNINATIP